MQWLERLKGYLGSKDRSEGKTRFVHFTNRCGHTDPTGCGYLCPIAALHPCPVRQCAPYIYRETVPQPTMTRDTRHPAGCAIGARRRPPYRVTLSILHAK